MHIDIAALTSKGQFTIPGKLRDLLRLSAGSEMIMVCDGEHLLLKPTKEELGRSLYVIIVQYIILKLTHRRGVLAQRFFSEERTDFEMMDRREKEGK